MAIYAVGDLQGCLKPLQCLLEQVEFDTSSDQLWCAGDIVNRGPQSLETLRFINSLGDNCRIVLGNHDLHLLAVAFTDASLKRKDTLSEILQAPDADELLHWLRQQPLIHSDAGYTMVHAGINPYWDLTTAHQLANEVESVLQGDNYKEYFTHMYGNHPENWQDSLTGMDRLRVITNYFTRMRFCYDDGSLDLDNKLGPDTARPGTRPWFTLPERKAQEHKIIFGHWASLEGYCQQDNLFALDTGCVWGGKLSMMRLGDNKLWTCSCKA